MRTGCMAKTAPRAWAGRLSALAVVLALLAGCAQEQAYQRGERLARQGQYEQAVAELETAIRLAEEHHSRKAAEKYRDKLAEVKVIAGQFLYREAQLRFGQADLGGAQGYLERCVKFCPQEPMYEALRQRVLQAIAEAERVRADALALAEQKQWQAAGQRMDEALALYRTLPGGQADRQRIRDRAYRYYLDRADERLHEGNLAEAQAEATTALTYQASGREAQTIIETVNNRREAGDLIARGQTLLGQGQSEEALRALARAAQLYPAHPDLADLLGQAKRAVCDRRLEQGRTALAARDYAAALRLFQSSRDLLNGYGGVDALLTEVRSRLAERHLELSRQYQQEGAAGIATFHAGAALSYLPDSAAAQSQLRQCAEQVRQDVGYTVAFTGFESAPAQRSLAALLASAALEHLTRTHPENVRIVERAGMPPIPDVKIMEQANVPPIPAEELPNIIERNDPPLPMATGRQQDVDAVIVGQVLEGKVTSESKVTGQGESVYQDGYRRQPNPERVPAASALDAAVQELERCRHQLAEAEVRLERFQRVDPHNPEEVGKRHKAQAEADAAKRHLLHAAEDVGAAKVRLASIPPEVLVPNMVRHQYPIEMFTWTARIVCMVKMLDTATGEVLCAERVEGQESRSDRTVAADPARNVPQDPLVLPSESALLEAAANSALVKIRQILSQACARHGQRFLLTMRRAEASGATVRALDNGVKYLFAYPTGDTHANAVVESLRRYLANEDGLLDIRAILRTHCHVLL
jgi:tetratricopeptide (TPR) repeat protein